MTVRPIVLITGASSGIGAALARVFAAHGYELALVALPDPQLDTLAGEIARTARTRPLTLPLDLTHRDAGMFIADGLAAVNAEPIFVVNCAGFGLVGAAAELDCGEQLAMVDLNVRALTDLSLRFADSLARHRGGLLNVASVSAFLPGRAWRSTTRRRVSCCRSAKRCIASSRARRAGHGLVFRTGPDPVPGRAGIRATLPRVLACSPDFVAQEAFAGLMAGQRLVVPGAGNKLLRSCSASFRARSCCPASSQPCASAPAARPPVILPARRGALAMPALRPLVVVTGASSGIGAALARVFAANGHDLALVARRLPALTALADEIAATGKNRPLVVPIDLTRVDSPVRMGHELGARGFEPAYIVNNAGFGLVGRAAELDRGEQLAMIDLNVRALTELSLRFIDSLARHRGGILNVASVSAFLPGPGMALYHATKSFVLSFRKRCTRSWRRPAFM